MINTIELLQFSLGLAFEHVENLVSDLTQDKADWLPPGNANPIGSHYWHIIAYVDQIMHEWFMEPFVDYTFEEFIEAKLTKWNLGMGQTPLRQSAGWTSQRCTIMPTLRPKHCWIGRHPSRWRILSV